jgi:precorrin-3B methylase
LDNASQRNQKIFKEFPDPNVYNHYSDFEEAALEWKKEVLKHLQKAQLPVVMGRTYARPRIQSALVKI